MVIQDLLSEADMSRDIIVQDIRTINRDLDNAHVVLAIGANDIINPTVEDKPNAKILGGMPVLRVRKSPHLIVIKSSLAVNGFSGIDNPVLTACNTEILLGDTKDTCEKLISSLEKICT